MSPCRPARRNRWTSLTAPRTDAGRRTAVAAFEPVLSRNWNVPDGHTLKVYESRGGYQACAQGPDDDGPRPGRRRRQGLGAARPRRRGLPVRAEVDVPAEGPQEPLHVRQRRRERAGTFNNRILMEKDPHQFLEGILIACFATRATHGLHLHPLRVHPRLPRSCEAAIDEAQRGRAPGQEHLRHGLQPGRLRPPRGRGVHLRRGDRADREPGRQARLAADQAAVPGHRGGVPQADGRQQRRDARPASRTSSSAGPTGSSRSGTPKSYGPKLYCVSGHVNKQVCVELPLGVTCRELIDEHGGGVWKGRKAKAAVPGGISMGAPVGRRVRHAARLRRASASPAASAWAPPP